MFFGLPKMEKIAATSSSRRPPLAVVLGRCIRNRRSEPLHRRNQWRFCHGRWRQWRNCGITSTSRLGFLSEEHTRSSTGSNSMLRRNEDDVTFYWSEKQKYVLLTRLVEYNKNNNGRQPEAADWEQWANDLSPLFSSPIPPSRVKEAKERLKKKFNAELALRTNTGLGWDPVKNFPTCTDEYWNDFCKTHKWAKRARKDPLKNYELYYEAFASRRACGAFETDMEENEEEYDTSQPQVGEGYIVGGTSQSLDGEESFLRTMRGPLNSSGRPLNIASSSRPILKRPSKSGGRLIDPEAKSVLKSIATTLKSRQNSRGTSSGASQPITTPNTTFKQCQQIIGEMSLDDEQIVCFVEYLNWNPNCQALFLCLNESQRLVYALKTLKSLANQPTPSLQPQFSFFMNPAAPFMGSQAYFMPPQQNFPHQHAPFPQRGPNFNPQPPTFQQPTPNFQQPAPNFQHSPQYYMGSQFPNFPRQFGGKGSDNVV